MNACVLTDGYAPPFSAYQTEVITSIRRERYFARMEGLEPDQPSVLETAALPIELHPYMLCRVGRNRTGYPSVPSRGCCLSLSTRYRCLTKIRTWITFSSIHLINSQATYQLVYETIYSIAYGCCPRYSALKGRRLS